VCVCVCVCVCVHARARVITTLGSIIFPFIIFSFLSLHVYNTYKISRLGNRWKARIGMSVTLLLVKSLKQFKSRNVNKRFIKIIHITWKYSQLDMESKGNFLFKYMCKRDLQKEKWQICRKLASINDAL